MKTCVGHKVAIDRQDKKGLRPGLSTGRSWTSHEEKLAAAHACAYTSFIIIF